MSWSRWSLLKKGFLYDPTPIGPGKLPPHGERLRETILDFSCLVPTETGATQLESIEASLTDPDVRARLKNPSINAAENIREEAQRLHGGGFSEDEWVYFFIKMFFDRLGLDATSSGQESRVSSRAYFHYEAFVRERDGWWGLFTERFGLFAREYTPKPDLVFFLPIYDTGAATVDATVAFSDQKWKQFPVSSLVEPFTLATLNELSSYGLNPGPRPISDSRTGTTTSAQLRCWPWLIVELKKIHEVDAAADRANEYVCCQATNAAGCALQLQQQLARYSIPLPDESHVAPIPTMTTQGSRVTIWIAYYANGVPCSARFGNLHSQLRTGTAAYIMQAIWEGDMTKLGDILRFRMALENIHTWACRWFRPHVAVCIDQWKSVHLRQDASLLAGEVSARRENFRRAAPLVDALLNEYKTLPLDFTKYDDKVNPLVMSLILQQMTMSSHKSLLEGIQKTFQVEIGRILSAMHFPEQASQAKAGPQAEAGSQSAGRDGLDTPSEEGSDTYNPESAVRDSTEATSASRTASHLPNPTRNTRSNVRYVPLPMRSGSPSVEATPCEDTSSELSLPMSRSETPTGVTGNKSETSVASASSPSRTTFSFRSPIPFSYQTDSPPGDTPPIISGLPRLFAENNTGKASDGVGSQATSSTLPDANPSIRQHRVNETAKEGESDIPPFDTNKILWRAGAKFSWEETTGRLWKGYKYHTYSKDEVSIISLIPISVHLVDDNPQPIAALLFCVTRERKQKGQNLDCKDRMLKRKEILSVVCEVTGQWLALNDEGDLGWIWGWLFYKVPEAQQSDHAQQSLNSSIEADCLVYAMPESPASLRS